MKNGMVDNTSDAERVRFSIQLLTDIKALGRDAVLGDKWVDLVIVIGALKRVLEEDVE